MYLGVFLFIFISYIISCKFEKHEKKLYFAALFIMWFMLAFRFGQGSDYFGYYYNFKSVTSVTDAILNTNKVHGEIGFRVLCSLCFDNYYVLILLVSTFQMAMLHRCVSKYSSNRVLSLLLFYPTFYLTYYFSGIRQGIIIAIFIGLLLECIEKDKWALYLLGVAFAMSFHKTALILVVAPAVKKIKIKWLVYLMILCGAVGVLLTTDFAMGLLKQVRGLSFYIGLDISILALGERVLMTIVIFYLYYKNILNSRQKTDSEGNDELDYIDLNAVNQEQIEEPEKTSNIEIWLNLYLAGMCVYLLFIGYGTIASRLFALFKVLEIVILPELLNYKVQFKGIIKLGVIALCCVMLCKNLHTYARQGDYKEEISFYNYPYISVFNRDRLWDYKIIDDYEKYFR